MSGDPDLLTIEEMSAIYYRDKRARVAPNAWAHLPVCPCGFRVGPGDRCAKCRATQESLQAPPTT